MKLANVRVLRGPNMWALLPVIEVELEVTEAEASRLVDAVSRGLAALPNGAGNASSPTVSGRRGEAAGTAVDAFAEAWSGLLAGLQSAAFEPVRFRRIERLTPTTVHVSVEFHDETLAKAAVDEAVALLEAGPAMADSIPKVVRQLAETARTAGLSKPDAAVAAAAQARGIPWRRLTSGGALQLGYGSHQRLVSRLSSTASTTGSTSFAPVQADLVEGLAYALALPFLGTDATGKGRLHRALVVGGKLIGLVAVDSATDVAAQAHPALVSRCVEAARALELNVCVLELSLSDATQPPESAGGGLIQVLPGLEADPAWMSPALLRRFGEAVVDTVFPSGETGRIPIATITGVNGKTTTTRLLAKFMGSLGHRVGMTCSDGISVAERIIDHDDCSGPRSARRCLRNPTVDAGVFEVARGGILREGLGFDQSDVAIVTNIADGDHLGISWVNTPADLARIKQVTVQAVAPNGHAVLHAEDPLTVAMAGECRGQIIYFTRKPDLPLITEHRAKGGIALIERDGQIVIAEGPGETVVMKSSDIPLTRGGRLAFQVENVLAAVAAARSLGVPLANIRETLRTFDSDVKTCPGRFNVLEHNGTTIILDFGHNPSAVTALVQAVDQFPATKRHVVYSADGDRSDAQIRQQTANLGGAFDRVVLYEEPGRFRGRNAGDLYGLLQEGLKGCTRVKEIEQIDGELVAIQHALSTVRPGELLLIQVDAVSVDLDFVTQHLRMA